MDIKDRRLGIFGAFILLGLVAVALLNLYQAKTIDVADKPIAYSSFLDDVENHRVCAVAISGPDISGLFCDRHPFRTVAASDPDLVRVLRANHVSITALPPPDAGPSWNGALTALVPILLLLGGAGFFLWRRPGLGTQGTNLVKAPAKLLAQTGPSVTFADVAGVDEATESLQEIVDFLRSPQKFRHLGGRIPRGVLLVGPPGTGKTLLARAIAGEASVPFFSISGSSFVEMFVGIGAARVRALFDQAKKNAPCIIFMDEIDAVGRKRGAGLGGGNDEREQTLNQLLVEMDGFEANEGTILIAATNRPDILDPALLRPGRFDREIVVGKPDIKGRQQILAIHTKAMPLNPGVDLHQIARRTPGFSGADLANLVNEAALLAARRGKSNVGQCEFDDARDTITMGPERRTHVMTEKQRRLIAYREGGRAIVSLNLPLSEPLHKVTIMTRGRNSGMVGHQSEDEQDTMTQEQMLSRLTFLMAGRAAEEMTFGRPRVTAASASDIDKATKLARTMVTKWGLSDALGAITYDDNQDEVFLGHAIARQQNVSDETAQKITTEIRNLLDVALGEARRILEAHRNELEALAKSLLEFETLSGEEISSLLAGKVPARTASQ